MVFTGFTTASIEFLKNLAANNNKEWFENNRNIYETCLLEPLKQLSMRLGVVVSSIDKEIEIAPQVNKTISKIYRDTRFSRNKSPFRTGLWLTFKRPHKLWGNVPEFYFYFTPEEYQYGMGYYAATSDNMRCLREYISRYPQRFREIIEAYKSQSCFALAGKNYKKAIPNELSEEFQSWFQKKNIEVSCIKKIDRSFYGKDLGKTLANAYQFNAALYLFITDSLNK
ncbi:MAG: DUF2461 domain-containing protein [Bacteroides sp.]|jgi:uncharacterized protein (TIGR02453 family)|nr:DUF2461 domain-containing protein [Bacteroides sp.]